MPDELSNSPPSEAPHESVTLPSPPPELAKWVEMFSPGNMANDDPSLSLSSWWALADQLGLQDAVAASNFPGNPAFALAFVLAGLPRSERFEISRRHPFEVFNVAAWTFEFLQTGGNQSVDDVTSELIAPEILAAVDWMRKNQPAALFHAAGLEHQLN